MSRQPRDLPNIDGFEFIGIDADGDAFKCVVKQDQEMKFHYVEGEIKYCDLIAWEPINLENK